MRSTILGALAICVSAALWGLDGVALTPRLYNLPVPLVVFLLHAVPFVLMQPFLHRSYRTLKGLQPGDWVVLLLVALTGGILGTFSIVKALFLVNFNQLSVVVLLQKLQPVFAIVLAGLLLKERITPRFLSWAAVAIAGAYLLTFGLALPDLDTGAATARAALWAAIAAAAFGSATVFGKRLLSALDFREATFGRYGLTTLLALLYLLVSGTGVPLAKVTTQNWMLILVIGLTTGSGAIFLYYFGLTRVRAIVATICELSLPLSAILFDYLINGSLLGPWQWLGAAVLIVAITMVSLRPANRPQPQPATQIAA
ncbi:MAG: DMT family transporter [Acidobacteria bacterium]|nr:MAG: DMT family transporter [Acidobacteriota bacterium]